MSPRFLLELAYLFRNEACPDSRVYAWPPAPPLTPDEQRESDRLYATARRIDACATLSPKGRRCVRITWTPLHSLWLLAVAVNDRTSRLLTIKHTKNMQPRAWLLCDGIAVRAIMRDDRVTTDDEERAAIERSLRRPWLQPIAVEFARSFTERRLNADRREREDHERNRSKRRERVKARRKLARAT